MADIVERLRGWSGQTAPVSSTDIYTVTQEAAAEIEKLREEVLKAGEMLFNQAKTIQSLQQARNEALEEAAKVADGKAEKASDFAPHIGRAATEIAAVIRALKENKKS